MRTVDQCHVHSNACGGCKSPQGRICLVVRALVHCPPPCSLGVSVLRGRGGAFLTHIPSPALFYGDVPQPPFIPCRFVLIGEVFVVYSSCSPSSGLPLVLFLCLATCLLIFSVWRHTWLCCLEARIFLMCLAALRLLPHSRVSLHNARVQLRGTTC